MKTLLRLTNYNDWECLYTKNEDGVWELREAGHSVRLESALRLVGVDLTEVEFEFDGGGYELEFITDEQLAELESE